MTLRPLSVLALGFLLLTVACGGDDDPAATGTAGPGTGGAGATGGGGGAGGDEPCPPGSHDDGAGSCAAELGGWQTAPSIADARDHHVTFSMETPAGTFLYVLGGAKDQMNAVLSIERSLVAADGTLGAWETLETKKLAIGPSVAKSGNLVLVAGGQRGEISPRTDLLTIFDDGLLALAPGPDMLHPRFHHAMLEHEGWVYAVGGAQVDATSQTSVERIQFDAQGLGTWTEDRPLPLPRSHHALVQHGGALYAIAGLNRYDGDPFPYEDDDFSDILRAPIGDDGSLGEWATVGQLPDTLAVHAALVHLDQLYVVGGLEGSGGSADFIDRVQRAAFASDGSVGAFEDLPVALPKLRGHTHQVPFVGPVVYSIAGAASEGLAMKSQVESFFATFE